MKTKIIFSSNGILIPVILFLIVGIQVKAQNIANSSPVISEQDAPIPEYWAITKKVDPALTEELERLVEDFIHLHLSSAIKVSVDSITSGSVRMDNIQLYGYGDVTGNMDGVNSISIEINNGGLTPLSILSEGTLPKPVLKDEAPGKALFEQMFLIVKKSANMAN